MENNISKLNEHYSASPHISITQVYVVQLLNSLKVLIGVVNYSFQITLILKEKNNSNKLIPNFYSFSSLQL